MERDMIPAALIAALTPIIGQIVGNKFPDPEQRAKQEAEAIALLLQHREKLALAAADIVKAEAQSEHWMTSAWRPITMLIFVALIAARWLGLVTPNLSEAEYMKLWEIVQIGLCGYTLTRSAEKIAPTIADALIKR
jgi:hypothetical protein